MSVPETIAIATTAAELESLASAVHDKWFGLSRIRQAVDVTLIPVTDEQVLSKAAPGTEGLELLVRGVAGPMRVVDEARIEWYDINELFHEASAREIVVTSGFPLELRVPVDRLEVELRRARRHERAAPLPGRPRRRG